MPLTERLSILLETVGTNKVAAAGHIVEFPAGWADHTIADFPPEWLEQRIVDLPDLER